eukprot:GILJ01005635.1.p1 GENE.GILJ01005635.1~~GILJ01005635.1.p1  ORF type:complete len:120 (+),score=19.79 GILJ01005635.1:43-360(+)
MVNHNFNTKAQKPALNKRRKTASIKKSRTQSRKATGTVSNPLFARPVSSKKLRILRKREKLATVLEETTTPTASPVTDGMEVVDQVKKNSSNKSRKASNANKMQE